MKRPLRDDLGRPSPDEDLKPGLPPNFWLGIVAAILVSGIAAGGFYLWYLLH